MINTNLFTKSLLISTFLLSLSSAKAMFGEDGSIDEKNQSGTLSIKILKQGYELGLEGKYIDSKDGKRYLVTQNKNSTFSYYNVEPYFPSCMDDLKVYGFKSEDNEFCFTYSEGGGPTMKWNPETQQMEEDPDMPWSPPMEQFNLLVKRILDDDESLHEASNLPAPLPTSDNIIIESKLDASSVSLLVEEDELVEKRSNSKNSRIFKEPTQFESKAEKSFYTTYDPERDLYYGIELLTQENSEWWKRRLGFEAYMRYEPELEIERRLEMEKTPEQRMAEQENNRAFAEAMGNIFGHTSSSSSIPEAQTFIWEHGAMSIYDETFIDETFKSLFAKQFPYSTGGDYLGAWRGFDYNLNSCDDNLTWVAYVSSKPIQEPLHSSTSVTSPDIKMAMTLKMSKTFYAPLGIYNSPIAQAFDIDQGTQTYRQLSMPFHSTVARFINQIDPDVKYMVVRPLQSMAAIFIKMSLPFSQSKGRSQAIDFPYVRCTTDFPRRWGFIPDTLSSDETEKFGDSPYILIDPRTDEYYQIDNYHWFSKSPFLGGVTREKIETFPFFTIDVKALGSL
ncbi:MAG: hypothetical protein K2P93_00765 [Alphaproteobacteria bacterium]|nr:hypothetical protein [Alphaproteobacteria bacterium]